MQAPTEFDDLRTMVGVRRAMHAELSTAAEPAECTSVLDVANVLFNRALLEDLRPERRLAGGADLRQALADASVARRDDPADAFLLAGERAGALVRCPSPDAVTDVLRTLVRIDLPDLGVDAPADLVRHEESVMNSLNEQEKSTLPKELVADYLADRLEPGTVVHAVVGLSGGFSKTTTLMTIERPGRAPEEIVLRQVAPGRDSHTLVGEYDVVRYVWERGADVPEPLWIEPADNPLGGPFFASRRAGGTNVGDVFGPTAGTGPEVGNELAGALGRLHAIAVETDVRTPVPPMSDRTEILAAIDEQQKLVHDVLATSSMAAHPLTDVLFEWLRTHAPDVSGAPVLLHGDPGFHNMLVLDGSLTAMLDWERARVGDPAQDLAYVRPHVTAVQPWDEFIDSYCAAGGSKPDEELLRFYGVWHDTWRFAGAYRGLGRLRTSPRTLLDGVLGLLHAPRFLLHGLETAFEVTL